MATLILKKNRPAASLFALKRILLVQVVPFVLMMLVGSWLTLMAGQVIDQQRGEIVVQTLEEVMTSRF